MPKRHVLQAMVVGAAALSATACGGGGATTAETTPAFEERTFALKVTPAELCVDLLRAELSDLTVVERVRSGSGETVEPPKMRGTLKLKNTAVDRTVRLVGGAIEFLGEDGRVIALAPGRGDGKLTFYGYMGDRLDPGQDTRQSVEVPFPAAVLDDTAISDVRLSLTFVPMPYRTEATTVSVTLAATSQ
jgi:hypothetical protein